MSGFYGPQFEQIISQMTQLWRLSEKIFIHIISFSFSVHFMEQTKRVEANEKLIRISITVHRIKNLISFP